ncbi:MAG: D-alanyl-D-alanine carboxypeptidase family protein [Alphaproteobacteria bacterium]|nr:D-alanyl-D-alanine carboxypeptidase family protein [Alphaproteobacteria bacterium]
MKMIKAYIRYVLYLLKMRTTIPGALINKKPIRENGDELVDLRQVPGLFFDKSFGHRPVLIRSGVAERLKQAQTLLPSGLHFKILSAYRSMKEQQELYDFHYQQMKTSYPRASATDWERMTKAICAKPGNNAGSGHQTGGAIDITLCDELGNELDMGTKYLEMCSKTPTASKEISEPSRNNRKILKSVLHAVGMQNYPNEWWHFCYGDRMWAMYQHQKYALYGPRDSI